jgi:hypothetical protein
MKTAENLAKISRGGHQTPCIRFDVQSAGIRFFKKIAKQNPIRRSEKRAKARFSGAC